MGTDDAVKCGKQGYVIGFMFSEDGKQVALLRRQRPHWHQNKLNGIGGKIDKVEGDETPLSALTREFEEKTGLKTSGDQWRYFACLDGVSGFHGPYTIHCFASLGDLSLLKSTERGTVEVLTVKDISLFSGGILSDALWLTAMAHDHLYDRRPLFVSVDYP